MFLKVIKNCIVIYAGFFVSVNFSFGQGNFFDPRIRGYVQDSTPSSFYMQEMDVPSIMQGVPPLDELERFPEELTPFETQGILFDRKIDPDTYTVGPGDVIGLYLWGDLDREFRNAVTPEGLLIIPTVGGIMVGDMTLTEVRDVVKDKVRLQYKDVDVTVFLVRPRLFRLYISGMVLNPGMIGSSPLERVSDVIERAGLKYVEKVTMIEDLQSIQPERNEDVLLYNTDLLYGTGRSNRAQRLAEMMRDREISSPYEVIKSDAQVVKKGASQRSIVVYRGDQKLEVDLFRFRKLGDLDNNPYVAMGDRIHVPQYIGDIIISGEVNEPDRYEFKLGDRVSDLVVFGGGLTVLADTTRATLVRFTPDGHILQNIDIDLYDALVYNPDDPRYILEESDRLYVRKKYNYKKLAHVVIDGQVKFPGQYAISSGITKLSEIIELTGGFTPEANLEEARFVRRITSATADLEYERLRRMTRMEMTEVEYDYLRSRSRMTRGKLTVNFVKLFNDHDLSDDIILEYGDNIYIPAKREFIQVSGAIGEPGYLKLEPGKDYIYYIELAGGYKWDANSRKVRIIKSKTGQRFRPGKKVTLEGGDIIHVPEKTPIEKWEFFKDSALVFANVATVVILARQLTK